jgi:hypothetical protein
MTCMADNEGLAVTRRHHLDPGWLLGPSRLVEIGQFPHVMDLRVLRRAAEFTVVRQESPDQLVALGGTGRSLSADPPGSPPVGAAAAVHQSVLPGVASLLVPP